MRSRRVWLLVALSLYPPTATSTLLFDPGIEPADRPAAAESELSSPGSSHYIVTGGAAHSDARRHPPASEGSLIYPRSSSVSSLPPGCRRSSDFFAHVCPSPPSSSRAEAQPGKVGGIEGDLLICDLPSPEPLVVPDGVQGGSLPRKRSVAISGTVTFSEDAPAADSLRLDAADDRGRSGPSQGSHPAAIDSSAAMQHVGPLAPPTSADVYPAPEAEGFWRQQNGQYEWHPSSPDPLLPSSPPSASESIPPIRDSASSPPSPSFGTSANGAIPDQAQIRAYDAWSAEQEGQGFLSFSEWKERYVDAVQQQKDKARKEAESDRTKQKSKKHRKGKDAAAQATPEQSPASSTSASSESEAKPSAAATAPLSASSSSRPMADASSQPAASNPSPEGQQAPPSPAVEMANAARDTTNASSSEGVVQTQAAGLSSQADGGAGTGEAEATSRDVATENGVEPSTRGQTPSDASSQLTALKHRWNFASFDCAAVVHRTNPSAKFASAILSEKKDRYMLSPCPGHAKSKDGEGQFVIVELCDKITIDTLVLANYEFFSSMFKKFRVSAAQKLKGGEDAWKELGTFRARNVRGPQVFNMPPSAAAHEFYRYVRIDFLEHYGTEFYCPVSLLRVYGLTEMEEYNRAEEEAGQSVGFEDGDEVEEEHDDEDEATVDAEEALTMPDPPPKMENRTNLDEVRARDEDVWRRHEKLFRERLESDIPPRDDTVSGHQVPDRTVSAGGNRSDPDDRGTSSGQIRGLPLSVGQGVGSRSDVTPRSGGASPKDLGNGICDASEYPASGILPSATTCGSGPPFSETAHNTSPLVSASNTAAAFAINHTVRESTATRADSTATDAKGAGRPSAATSQEAKAEPAKVPPFSSPPPPSSSRLPSSHFVAPPPSASSGGSESIYRTIARRLNALEANATLSLSYIEHSGQMLREVFARMEKRQDERMTDMLRWLNTSNWRQIEALKRRQQVDLQRAIFEFDVHRQQAEVERLALMDQVHALADEVLLEKRLGIAQLVLLFSLFVLMGLTRGSRAAPFLHSSIARISGTPAARLRAVSQQPQPQPKQPLGRGKSPGQGESVALKVSDLGSPLLKPPTMSHTGSSAGGDPQSVAEVRPTASRRMSSTDKANPAPATLGSPMKFAAHARASSKHGNSRGIARPVPLAGSLLGVSPYGGARPLRQPMDTLGLSTPLELPRKRKARIRFLQRISALSELFDALQDGQAAHPRSGCQRSGSKVAAAPPSANSTANSTEGFDTSADSRLGGSARELETSVESHARRRSPAPSHGGEPEPAIPAMAHGRGRDKPRPPAALQIDKGHRRSSNHEGLYQTPPRAQPGLIYAVRPKPHRATPDRETDEAAGLSSDWTERSEEPSELSGISETDDDAHSVDDAGMAQAPSSRSRPAFAGLRDASVSHDRSETQMRHSMPPFVASPTSIATPYALPARSTAGSPANGSHRIAASASSHPRTPGLSSELPTIRIGAFHAPSPPPASPLSGSRRGSPAPLVARFPPQDESDSDSDGGGAWQRVLPRRSASNSLSRKSRHSTPESNATGVRTVDLDGSAQQPHHHHHHQQHHPASFLRRLATPARAGQGSERTGTKSATPEAARTRGGGAATATATSTRSGTPDTIRGPGKA